MSILVEPAFPLPFQIGKADKLALSRKNNPLASNQDKIHLNKPKPAFQLLQPVLFYYCNKPLSHPLSWVLLTIIRFLI